MGPDYEDILADAEDEKADEYDKDRKWWQISGGFDGIVK